MSATFPEASSSARLLTSALSAEEHQMLHPPPEVPRTSPRESRSLPVAGSRRPGRKTIAASYRATPVGRYATAFPYVRSWPPSTWTGGTVGCTDGTVGLVGTSFDPLPPHPTMKSASSAILGFIQLLGYNDRMTNLVISQPAAAVGHRERI